jgi:YARHG domain
MLFHRDGVLDANDGFLSERKRQYGDFMKRCFIIIALVLRILADDTYLGSEGGNVFPASTSNIKMIKEDIDIQCLSDSCIVLCKFWFCSETSESFIMGFPDYFDNPARTSDSLRNFNVKIDKMESNYRISTQNKIYTDKDTTVYEKIKWFNWPTTINKGETLFVENYYTGSYGAGADGFYNFVYILGTGNKWRDNIEKGRIVFHFGNLISPLFLDTTELLYKKGKIKLNIDLYNLEYTFNSYKPGDNDKVDIRFMPFWKCIYGSFSGKEVLVPFNLKYYFDKNKRSKSDYRLIRNEVYARHGYIFKDKDLGDYFSKMKWYKPDLKFKIENLNYYEKAFVKSVKFYEDQCVEIH